MDAVSVAVSSLTDSAASLSTASGNAGTSERSFRRACVERVGIPPKMLMPSSGSALPPIEFAGSGQKEYRQTGPSSRPRAVMTIGPT
jgi:hypothetical protein